MTLSPIDQKILCTILDIYCNKKAPVGSGEIASVLNRNPGAIRNRMPILVNLGFVDSLSGPKGGYMPTTKAYTGMGFNEESAVLSGISKIVDEQEVEIKGINVQSIEFIGIAYLKKCGARVKIIGNTKDIEHESVIKIGPIPSGLVVVGKIIGSDDVRNVLLIEILKMYIWQESLKDFERV